MTTSPSFRIAVFNGDGIGPEITTPCLDILRAAQSSVGGFDLSFEELPAGAGCYRDTGEALPKASMDTARAADAILLSAMGLPEIRLPDGTEIQPQLDLRFELDLYAGLRPIRAIPGVPVALADPRARDIDFMLVRESTEGLFASVGKSVVTADEARDTMVITRHTTSRLCEQAFALAEKRKQAGRPGKLTCVDKANVFGSMAFFRSVFMDAAANHKDITPLTAYVDATALTLVQKPWDLDVLVTENMFGDILSDLAAGLIGGMGYAPSADIGDEHAVFQPCHGSAPDIAGKGLANPTAMFLSGAMMLEWLAEKHDVPALGAAGALIREAVDSAFAGGKLVTPEVGGKAGTADVTAAVLAEISRLGKMASAAQ
ncbi:isocitrate/isopropylmalate dehydrogenase family protein [Alphaproteobacteria bacterium HT1-32]|nr:isocitrate/isopropylmalate dehydrogenase family protein [Alphaproteobacteria bacterium HT1-32]